MTGANRLDAGYGAAAPPERQSVSSSPIRQIPRSSQAQGRRLGGCPRSAPISPGRCSQAGMGLVRILAANHSSRHPTLRVCRCRGAAPNTSRFSLDFLQSLRSREIHRRSARHSKYEDIRHDGIIRTRHSRVTNYGVKITPYVLVAEEHQINCRNRPRSGEVGPRSTSRVRSPTPEVGQAPRG